MKGFKIVILLLMFRNYMLLRHFGLWNDQPPFFRAFELLNESLLYCFLSWVGVPNTAVLLPLLQGAVSATCNIYSHFILWVCHLVHSKYTYLYTRSTIPFHLRSKKKRIMFECIHCLVSCVVTTLHEGSYVHTKHGVAAGVSSQHR